jgi:hypothetical protein
VSRIEHDLGECKQLSLKASGNGAVESAKGAVVGGLLGAAGGAALGALSGDAASGAALGAAIGGFGGGTKKGFETNGSFKEVFKKCMQYRGHTVLD